MVDKYFGKHDIEMFKERLTSFPTEFPFLKELGADQ